MYYSVEAKCINTLKSLKTQPPCLVLAGVFVCGCVCADNRCFAGRFWRERARERDEEEDRICLTSISGRRRVEQQVKMDGGFLQSPLSSFYACVSVCAEGR